MSFQPGATMLDLNQGQRCTLLAIDPGAKSGAAIFGGGELVASLQINNNVNAVFERQRVIQLAIAASMECKKPLMVVREMWTPGGRKMRPATYAGMGASWGAWREWLLLARLPKSRIISVYPVTWQCALLGNNREAEKKARLYVKAKWGNENIGPDEASAICMGQWALRSQLLHDAIPSIDRAMLSSGGVQ